VWSSKAAERGTAAVLAPVMERLGSDWSLLSLPVRVVELDKVGERESEELYIVHILFLQKVSIKKCNIDSCKKGKFNSCSHTRYKYSPTLMFDTALLSCLWIFLP
jgi:hypothetical protein